MKLAVKFDSESRAPVFGLGEGFSMLVRALWLLFL